MLNPVWLDCFEYTNVSNVIKLESLCFPSYWKINHLVLPTIFGILLYFYCFFYLNDMWHKYESIGWLLPVYFGNWYSYTFPVVVVKNIEVASLSSSCWTCVIELSLWPVGAPCLSHFHFLLCKRRSTKRPSCQSITTFNKQKRGKIVLAVEKGAWARKILFVNSCYFTLPFAYLYLVYEA